jgi:membrane fusion protein, multidrug efflux system
VNWSANSKKMAYVGVLSAAGAAVGGLILWHALRPTAASAGSAAPPVAVSVTTVTRRDVLQQLSAVGTVQSLTNVLLRPQIDGVLTQVLVHEGQHVERGQLLALIDDRALAAAVEQAHAEKSRNDANLKIAQLDLKRDENLLAEEAISRQAVEEQRALVDQLKATVQSNQAAAHAAEIQQSYARVVSPVTGKVGMRRVDPGNLVHANDATGLFSVVQVDPISVVFSLPQQDLPSLRPLLGPSIGADVTALDRDAGTQLASGHLMNADNQIDTATGTIQLRAVFSNPTGLLWPGEFVTVQLRTGIDRAATVVTSRAVQHGLDGAFVFRVKSGAAEVIPVSVQYEQGAVAAIATGLQPGDIVVTDGQAQLKAGAAVKVIPEQNSGVGENSDVELAERP